MRQRWLWCWCVVLMLVMLLGGCAKREADTQAGRKTDAKDQTAVVQQYARQVFEQRMDGTEYETVLTATAFYTREWPQIYMTGFTYTEEEQEKYYGYRIEVDENGNCQILEEGEEIAGFLRK